MGERKRRLAAGQGSQARFDPALIATAFRSLEAGDRAVAERALERLVATVPDHPDSLHACGLIALHLGRTAQAESLLCKTIALENTNPAARSHLAIAYRRLGKSDLAIAQLEKALELDSGLAEAHSNLGNLRLERGDPDAALRCFERALAIRRDYPDALNGLGEAQLMSGDCEPASANLERAIVLDPAFHEARYNLSRARMQCGAALGETAGDLVPPPVIANVEQALESIVAALEINADNPAYWTQFETCITNFDLSHPLDPRIRSLLLRAFDHPAIDPAALARPAVSLVLTHPDMQAIEKDLIATDAIEDRDWTELARRVARVLGEPLTQRLLENTVVPNALVQRLCAVVRRGLLDEWPRAEASLPLECIAAVAQQGFNTEYVNDETAAEREAISRLAGAIAAARVEGRAVPLHWYALYGCYRPLHRLDTPELLGADLQSTALRALATRHIDEPLAERRLRSEVPPLTGLSNAVSAALREQYEANPYPRWVRVRSDAAQPSVAAFLRRQFRGADVEDLDDSPARILIAGCGTGRHPIATALRFPSARIVAIDLSRTSLAYALRKTREFGIGNIEYAQADILGLGSVADRFDVIECVGVLHHLPAPIAGWKTLDALLLPGGVMRIGLYSEIARRHVVRAREVVAAEGFAPTRDGMRAFRKFVLAHGSDPPLARLARGEDFYSMSGLRDLAFSVEEHRFTLPQIAAMLSELRLAFLGFDLPDAGVAAAYRAQFPLDRTLTALDNWHEFEASRPDTFARMYQFWARKPKQSI